MQSVRPSAPARQTERLNGLPQIGPLSAMIAHQVSLALLTAAGRSASRLERRRLLDERRSPSSAGVSPSAAFLRGVDGWGGVPRHAGLALSLCDHACTSFLVGEAQRRTHH